MLLQVMHFGKALWSCDMAWTVGVMCEQCSQNSGGVCAVVFFGWTVVGWVHVQIVMARWIVLEVWNELDSGISGHGGVDGGNVSAERMSCERKKVDNDVSSGSLELECDVRLICGMRCWSMWRRPSMDRVMASG